MSTHGIDRVLRDGGEVLISKEDVEKNYIDAVMAGEILGVTRSRISKLCLAGRFQGAIKIGRSWIIPREAVLNHKPLPPGVKPRAERLRAERAALREEVEAALSGAKGEGGSV